MIREAKRRILIVDDEGDFVEMTTLRLEQAGFSVETAADGETALKKAPFFRPDVILLDLKLPDMEGWRVAELLRENPKTRQIPIIILTAAHPKDIAQRTERLGIERVILKPFD